MAMHRQSGHHYSNGNSDHVSVGIHTPYSQQQHKPVRVRRSSRSDKGSVAAFQIGAVILVICVVLSVIVLGYYYLSADDKEITPHHFDDGEIKNDVDFLTNVIRTNNFKVLGFGQGSVGHGRDSRYWDRDDRRRDGEYDEDDAAHDGEDARGASAGKDHDPVEVKGGKERTSHDGLFKGLDQRGVGLYNEDGRNELKRYEAEYEASLNNTNHSRKENDIKNRVLDDEDHGEQNELVDTGNEYDDGIDSHDPHVEAYGNSKNESGDHTAISISRDKDSRESSNLHDEKTEDQSIAKDNQEFSENMLEKSLISRILDNIHTNSQLVHTSGSQSTTKSWSDSKIKSRRRKFSGSCDMKFLNSTSQLVDPFESHKFARFSLQYVEMEERPNADEEWEPRFAGHQSLREREGSFLVHDQKIHCGFIKGPEGSPSTGFDLAEDDENYISRCHIAVISCIFGNSDRLRSPTRRKNKKIRLESILVLCWVFGGSMNTGY